MSRVMISAMGVVSPIGTGKEEFYAGITDGTSGTGTITNFDTGHLPVALGAEARMQGSVIPSEPDIDRRVLFNEIAFKELTDRTAFSQYAPPERMIIAGSGLDFFRLAAYTESEDLKKHQWQQYSDNTCRMFERLANQYSITGGVIVNASACVASSQAIGLAFRILAKGEKRCICAGGVDSMLNPLHYMGFYKLGALSQWKGDPQESCRPFDRDRSGVVLGEGAAYYLMESEAYATQKPLAWISGYASTMDAYLITDPDPDGKFLARAALEAIGQAGITPEQIDCVHTHGTGTIKNDVAECNAMKRIFGGHYRDVPVFSLKAQIGHLIGACGAVEIAAALYSFEKQMVPATCNFKTPDPAADLHVLKMPLKKTIKYILKLNAAFGGQNTAIVLQRAD